MLEARRRVEETGDLLDTQDHRQRAWFSRTVVSQSAASRRPRVTVKKNRNTETVAFMRVAEAPDACRRLQLSFHGPRDCWQPTARAQRPGLYVGCV